MPQESLSLESSKIATPTMLGWQGGSLRWKFVTAFGGLILLLGVCVIGIVYYLTGNALQRQVDLRSAAIAANCIRTALKSATWSIPWATPRMSASAGSG